MGALWHLLVMIDWLALFGFIGGIVCALFATTEQMEDFGAGLVKGSLWVFGIDSIILLLYAFILQIIWSFYVG